MFFIPKLSVLLPLILTTLTLAISQSRVDDAFQMLQACTPTLATTSRITTLTATGIATVLHSCYTSTVTTSAPSCSFNAATCVQAQCVTVSTTTVPCTDQCCPKTPTVTSTTPCQTACNGGCQTSIETVTAGCYGGLVHRG